MFQLLFHDFITNESLPLNYKQGARLTIFLCGSQYQAQFSGARASVTGLTGK